VLAAAVSLACPPGWVTAAAGSPPETIELSPLVQRVRENLERERQVLLGVIYREKRRPIKISPFGKVTIGDEIVFEVYPTSNPDRPRRVVVSINGKPATDRDREALARSRRRRPEAPSAREREAERRKDAEAQREAQARFDDIFRVFEFAPTHLDEIDDVGCRVVEIRPRPQAQPRTDVGRWMKKLQGSACVAEDAGELVALHMRAVDSILIGWGVVGRIAEGTRLAYQRRALEGDAWVPVKLEFAARGRTMLFRSFDVQSTTEWYDYRPVSGATTGGAQ
jgi:hypothetical protein